MADFKTHIAVSTLVGVGYGTAGYFLGDLPPPTCALAGGLCAVSGMMPDMDSGPGVPLRESMALAAAIVPMMLLDRFRAMGLSHESMILSAALVYLLIRFGMAELLRRWTTHRGMFHSLPAAAIAGQLAFLLASGSVSLRIYKAGAVVLGYLIHLALDELYSVEWHRGRLRLKNSFGTALKVFLPRKWWPNALAFTMLGLLTYAVLYEPGWADRMRQRRFPAQPEEAVAESLAEEADFLEALLPEQIFHYWR
jgi:membrane-bound metal-dependent hydrolase YbcI (DUF457 family)